MSANQKKKFVAVVDFYEGDFQPDYDEQYLWQKDVFSLPLELAKVDPEILRTFIIGAFALRKNNLNFDGIEAFYFTEESLTHFYSQTEIFVSSKADKSDPHYQDMWDSLKDT